MGQFKDVGDPALALAEECAEVIQIITKMKRFGGDWNEIAPGKDKSRWEMLRDEMADVMYQWERLKLSLTEPQYSLTCTCDEYDMCQQCCEEIKKECNDNGPTYDSAGFTEADR